MNDKKSVNKSILPGWGDWSFINPYWLLILGVVFFGVQTLLYRMVDYQGIKITDGIVIKRSFIGARDLFEVTGVGLISAIIYLAVIVAIVYISVWVLPNGRKHERLRFAGIFVLVGSAFKVVFSFVNLDLFLNIEINESFKLPIPTCADLYILGGTIAIVIMFAKKYSNQDIEEIQQK